MIVLDSAAAADYMLRLAPAAWVETQLDAAEWELHVPHVFDVEVAAVFRKLGLRKLIDPHSGAELVRALADLPVRRYPHVHLLERIWELRNTLTAPDAAFVGLAEALNAPLVTTDRRLARARGPRIPVLCP